MPIALKISDKCCFGLFIQQAARRFSLQTDVIFMSAMCENFRFLR